MTYLLDVNVLIALLDPSHTHYTQANRWFHNAVADWATSPIVEAGVIRVLSHPVYPNSPGSPQQVMNLIRDLYGFYNHHFWPDSVSLLDRTIFDEARIAGPKQITDTYLLALAKATGGQLATLDTHLSTQAVKNGQQSLLIIPRLA